MQKKKCLCLWYYTINHNENEDKNISHDNRYDTNTISVLAVSMMVLICIKQHLSNIWSSIDEKVQQHWRWVEKTRFL